MNIRCFIFATLSMLSAAGHAASGTIQFTGAITEPACVTDVAAERTQVRCSRAASVQALKIGASNAVAASPWDLAVVTQTVTPHRRDVVITYR